MHVSACVHVCVHVRVRPCPQIRHPPLPCCCDSSRQPGEHQQWALHTHTHAGIFMLPLPWICKHMGFLRRLLRCACVWETTIRESCSSFHSWWQEASERAQAGCQKPRGGEDKKEESAGTTRRTRQSWWNVFSCLVWLGGDGSRVKVHVHQFARFCSENVLQCFAFDEHFVFDSDDYRMCASFCPFWAALWTFMNFQMLCPNPIILIFPLNCMRSARVLEGCPSMFKEETLVKYFDLRSFRLNN